MGVGGCQSGGRVGLHETSLACCSSLLDHVETVLLQQLQKVPTSPNMDVCHNEIHGLLLQARALLSSHFK